MNKRAKHSSFLGLNEKGASGVKITAIVCILLFLLIGALTIYYNLSDRVEFTEEQIETATKIAQSELAAASSVAMETPIEEQISAIQSIGYDEPEQNKQVYTFEKHNDSEVYILLKLQPHEEYPNLSRVLIQVFDKENGAIITQLENVLTWK